MRTTAVIFGLLVAAVVGIAAWRGGWPLVLEGLRRGSSDSLKLLPLLFVVLALTGFVQVLLPAATVAKWLSASSGWRGLGVAWGAGALTPGGGPIGIPLAAALLRSGAGVGVVVTYLTSMSLLSFIRLPLELGIYGPRLTVLRVAVSVLLPPLAGMLAAVLAPWLGYR